MIELTVEPLLTLDAFVGELSGRMPLLKPIKLTLWRGSVNDEARFGEEFFWLNVRPGNGVDP